SYRNLRTQGRTYVEPAGGFHSQAFVRCRSSHVAHLGNGCGRRVKGRVSSPAPPDRQAGTGAALIEAMLAYKSGEYLDAIRIYRKILDAEPRNHEALHHFGM